MNKALVTLAGVLVSLSAFGQGQVVFANKDSAYNISAPVYLDYVGGTKLDGTAYYAQLFGGPAGTAEDALQSCGDPVNFRTGTAAGYIPSSVVTIPGVGYDTDAVVQMRAWSATAAKLTKNALLRNLDIADKTGLYGIIFREKCSIEPLIGQREKGSNDEKGSLVIPPGWFRSDPRHDYRRIGGRVIRGLCLYRQSGLGLLLHLVSRGQLD
jgi:hypothetical protein